MFEEPYVSVEKEKKQAADVWLIEQQHNRSVNQPHQGNKFKLTAHFLLLHTVVYKVSGEDGHMHTRTQFSELLHNYFLKQHWMLVREEPSVYVFTSQTQAGVLTKRKAKSNKKKDKNIHKDS